MKLKYRQRNRLTLQTSLNMRVPWIQCLTSVWDCFSPGPYPLHQRCPNDYLILYTHTTYFWGMSSIMSLVDTLLPSHGRGKDAMVSDPGIRLVGFTKLWASRRRVDRYIYIYAVYQKAVSMKEISSVPRRTSLNWRNLWFSLRRVSSWVVKREFCRWSTVGQTMKVRYVCRGRLWGWFEKVKLRWGSCMGELVGVLSPWSGVRDMQKCEGLARGCFMCIVWGHMESLTHEGSWEIRCQKTLVRCVHSLKWGYPRTPGWFSEKWGNLLLMAQRHP